MLKFILAITILGLGISITLAHARGGAGISQGYLNFVREQMVRDCVNACGQDGRCQAQCLASGYDQDNRPTEPRQAVPQAPRTDYSCVDASMKSGLTWGQSMQVCTH